MKVLYVAGAHALQCYDDCRMLADLGVEWYDTGYYSKVNGSGDLPPIYPYFGGEDFHNKLYQNPYKHPKQTSLKVNIKKNETYGGFCPPSKWYFDEDFMSEFDVVIFNHAIKNVINSYHSLRNTKCIFKTFGMHDINDEPKIGIMRQCGDVYIIRNNPTEYMRSGLYAGHDAIIRGSVVKDEEEISGWTGKLKQVVTFSNSFNYKKTDNHRRQYYLEIRKPSSWPFKLYGCNNEDDPLSEGGYLPHKEKVQILRDSRVNLIVGTPGSSNTYSLVEALVMGMPIVVFGKEMWQSSIYEIDQIIENSVHGFIVNSTSEARQRIDQLMTDDQLCKEMSRLARQRGVELFGRVNLIPKWRKVLFEEIWKSKEDREVVV